MVSKELEWPKEMRDMTAIPIAEPHLVACGIDRLRQTFFVHEYIRLCEERVELGEMRVLGQIQNEACREFNFGVYQERDALMGDTYKAVCERIGLDPMLEQDFIYDFIYADASPQIGANIMEKYSALLGFEYGDIYDLQCDAQDEIEGSDTKIPGAELMLSLLRAVMIVQEKDFTTMVRHGKIDPEMM